MPSTPPSTLRRTAAALAALAVLGAAHPRGSAAQRALAPGVRPYVSVDDDRVALVGVRVLDGTGGPARVDQTVLLRGSRIERVGPRGEVAVPAGARALALEGHTVVPGWVMVHEHLFYPAGSGAYNQQEYSFPKLYLAGGATTIRTGGSRDPYGDLNLRDAVDAGRLPGPRIHVTGPYVNGPGLPILFVHAAEDADDARALVRYWADQGATSFKAYMHVSREVLGAAIEEAHSRGLHVTGHLCSVTYREAADLGIDDLEHGLFAATDFVDGKEPDRCPGGGARDRSLAQLDVDGPGARALIRHLVDRGVALTSTLTVFETSTPGRPAAYPAALDAMAPQMRESYLRRWAAVQSQAGPGADDAFRKAMAFEKAFADAGGLLVAGTDPTGYGGVVAGYANQRMVELLHEAGFSAEEAVRIATLNGATLLGVEDEVGTVEAGKRADLVVLEGDPTASISAVREVRLVFKDGIGYDPAALAAAAEGSVGIR